MIERATASRLAGDWRGACAAADVDITFELSEVADHCGDDVATALEDDLRHLAPDLLRWYLPRPLGGGPRSPRTGRSSWRATARRRPARTA